MGTAAAANEVAEGSKAMRLALPDGAQAKLLAYLDLLAKWNRAYNLTAVRDPAEMVARHLLDSLAVLPFVHGATLADLGSGAGLPGIRSEEHTSELQSPVHLVCRLLLEKKKARHFFRAAGDKWSHGNWTRGLRV